jgi:RimJ/RimL family protein N-acetyltransferase
MTEQDAAREGASDTLGLGMTSATTVDTPRLHLRPWTQQDRDELERLWSDRAVLGRRVLPPERIAAIAESSLRQWRERGFGPWAALDRATGQWIGRVGLDELEDWPDADRVEVGFELHQAWWGRGLATEGARAALRFGFSEHRLERIISVTAPWNLAARRVMEKAGLTYQGTRAYRGLDPEPVWYAIDRATWEVRALET